MSQIELPQISVQRYVELLKRRRWQVIPVSLLGLLIGGLVAFFIPRYYVADAMLQHQRVPGDQNEARNPEDPFRLIVDTARTTIPQSVEEAMKKLSWPEIAVVDPYERGQSVREVQSRLVITDQNQSEARNRDVAQIRVTFRDQDGMRASSFLNTLVETWIAKRTDDLRLPIEQRRAQHRDEANRYRAQWDRLRDELQSLESQYGFVSRFPIEVQQKEYTKLLEDQKAQRGALDLKLAERAARNKQLALDQDALNRMSRRVPSDDSALLAAAAATPEGKLLLATIQNNRLALLISYQPGSLEQVRTLRAIEFYESLLKQLVKVPEADADGLVPNPAYVALLDKIDGEEKALALLEAEITPLQAKLDAEDARLAKLPAGFTTYSRKLIDLEVARRGYELANDDLRLDDAQLAQFQNNKTVEFVVRANPPPRPTEPNIALVALIGCVLGLGVAIGLILLLDFLQGSYKTIDDVERGLPVPVLGGISHLETEAERQQALRHRRRVSLTAAAFVFLSAVVITIFYIDPTRLPPFVRDLLAMLLGA
ncbi:MAG TPA: Wzz/FepE/Etk N-terminal domain-containing protein [Planctomycetota bacterium]|nr:Wzz/FepE/Etk N-terminal domain-containing protein [Planctomycetota bacterium]